MSSGPAAPAAPAVEPVQAAQPGEGSLRCDILLFVATTSEIEAVEEAAKSLNLKFEKRKGWASKYFDLGKVGDSRVMVLKTKMGPFSFGGSASKAIHAKIETGATALISVGMAFGVDRGTQPLGTLLVSKMLLPYDNREVITVDGQTVVNYTDVAPHNAKAALTQMLEREAEHVEWAGKVSFGAVLTGGAKIRCTAYRNELVSKLSNFGEVVIGGEMEGAGMLATCDSRDPVWVLVKGISDYADEHRNDEVEAGRKIACQNAALFVLKAIANANL